MRRILFIGAVNSNNQPLGGEEYKNQLFVGRLKEDFDTVVIDTFQWHKRPILILRMFWHLFFRNVDRIIISASSASTYRLLRILKHFPTKIEKTFYFVIGGYFPQGLKTEEFDISFYRSLKGIVVEGELLKQQISKVEALENISVIPNFKNFKLVKKNYSDHFKCNVIKFVFISRITRTKGVDTIFEAVKRLSAEGYENLFSVDFFGKIESSYAQEFLAEIDLSECSYKGELDLMNNSSESYRLLSDYHVMLFPTRWKGEGFPGVIIDAFVAGLPVIASDWNMNSELIANGKSGFLIPVDDSISLASAMRQVMDNRVKTSEMAINSSKESESFHLSVVWPSIKELLLRE